MTALWDNDAMFAPRSIILPIARSLRSGELTCTKLTRLCLACVKQFQPLLNCFISITEKEALTQAQRHDEELAAGMDRGALHGIPIVYKDNIDTAGARTTCGSEIFRDRIPHKNALVVDLLEKAGVVMLGKTNLNELAAGGKGGMNVFYGNTGNPWDLARESGGSSSGTAAALAAGLCAAGLGTDTGGSIRGPSSWCGIVGLRPTSGLLALDGIYPRAPTLDVVGPMARSVADIAILFEALLTDKQQDHDLINSNLLEYASSQGQTVKDLRIAAIDNFSFAGIDKEVAEKVREAIDIFEHLGAVRANVRIPLIEDPEMAKAARNVLLFEFAQSFHDELRCIGPAKQLLGPIVQKDLEIGSGISSADYLSAIRIREELTSQFQIAFQQAEILFSPTMPILPPLYASDMDLSGWHRQLTIAISMAGLPAISIPCGASRSGLPVGLQLVANRFQEKTLLRAGMAFERSRMELRPPVFCTALTKDN